MPLTCLEATTRLHQVKKLQQDFALALKDALQDSSNAIQLYQQLSYELAAFAQELEKNSPTITVKDAKNPFHEQFKAGSIPDTENPEKKEITYDLLKTLEEDILSYRSHGLEHWAKALEEYEDKITDLAPEQRKIIEDEIKNGAIPIWMPGKETLLATTVEQMEVAGQPLVIEYGQQLPLQNAMFDFDRLKHLVDNRDSRLAREVSNQPYLSLQRPTPQPDERTCNKTASDQEVEFAIINEERASNNHPFVQSISLYEYLALQVRSTEHAAGAHAGTTTLHHLVPLDSKTCTRFINLPRMGGGFPIASFNTAIRRMRFSQYDAGSNSWVGFRLTVRVEV